jgi:hypothetical protein
VDAFGHSGGGRCSFCAEPLDAERLERLLAVEAPLVCPACVDRVDPVALVREAADYAGVNPYGPRVAQRGRPRTAGWEPPAHAVRAREATSAPPAGEAPPDLDWQDN